MKLQQYYGNERNFFGSNEYEEYYSEIKKNKNIVYDDLNIVIDYKIAALCVGSLIILFSNISHILLENNNLIILYYYGKEEKKGIINDNKYIKDIYNNLNKVIEERNIYLNKYLENSKAWKERFDSYVFIFICDYKDLYLEIKDKKDKEIAKYITLIRNNEDLIIKYKNECYLITKEFKENVSNNDLEKFQFCYLLMHKYKEDKYLITLRVCKEKQ